LNGSLRQAALIAIFLVAVGLPAIVGWIQADVAVSAAEKRLLSPMPPWPTDWGELQRWPQRFEAYYDDHFGLRGPLAFAYSWLRFQLGDSPSPQVVRGTEGWFFLNGAMHGDPVGDYRNRNRFTPAQLQAFVEGLRIKQQWLRRRGIAYLFAVAPNKHTIYGDHLPRYLTKLAPESALDQLVRVLARAPDAPLLDLRPALRAARRSGLRPFQHTDSHWNLWGANHAQAALMEALAVRAGTKQRGRLRPARDFRWSSQPGGDLALLMGLQRILWEEVPQTDFPACARRTRRVAQDPLIVETRCTGGTGRILVFRDSFFDALQPYVSSYFAHAVYVDHRIDPELLRRLVARYRPDVVVEEWVERLLPMVPSAAGLDVRGHSIARARPEIAGSVP